MISLARHHTRWCLIATATLLVVAFALHDVSAQFRPPPTRPPGGNFSGNPGAGITGIPGGFAGNPGAGFSGISGAGFTGMPNNFSGVAGVSGVSGVAGVSGVSGISGFSGGIGGDRFEYFCSRCNTKVSQFATRCPNCGAIFTGTTFMPGSGPNVGGGGVLGNPGGGTPPFNGGGTPPGGNNLGQPGGGFPPMTPNPGTSPQPGGGFPPQNNPGTNPPQGNPGTNPPADNKPPADTPKTEPPSTSSSSSGSKSNSNDDKDSGLSTKVIVGASIAALGVFALIAGLVVVMNSGGAPAKKSRPRRFRDDDYD